MINNTQEFDGAVDVLVVGGGVVGLSAALFLQRFGVQPMLVERHAGTSIHPRSRGVNARVMELYRAVDVEARVREAGRATPISLGLLEGETLDQAISAPFGVLLRRLANGVARRSVFGSKAGPSAACRVTQDHLEPVLAAAAVERGADVRFSTELVALEQDAGGVVARLRDRGTGRVEVVRARYLLAADGARSRIRDMLAVGTSGAGSLGHLVNVLFSADLEGYVKGREFSLAVVHNPAVRGLFAAIDNRRRWVFHIAYDRAKVGPEAFTEARCAELIRTALGLGDLPLTIESVLPWECAAKVAERYRVGRVILVGDSAHVMPPWGGMGANTGIADAYDLAWKLAMVVKGEASEALLDTYEEERRPVAVVATDGSARRADPDGLMAPMKVWPSLFEKRPAGAPSGLVTLAGFGWRLASRLVLDDGGAAGFALDGRPGTRMPHVWIEREGARASSLDLIGTRYALVLAEDARCQASSQLDVDVLRAGDAFRDPAGRFRRAARLDRDGALLVRPDGVVAWRGPAALAARAMDRAATELARAS